MFNFFKNKKKNTDHGFVFTTKNLARETSNGDVVRRAYTPVQTSMTSDTTISEIPPSYYAVPDMVARLVDGSDSKDDRIEVHPIQVFNEIKAEDMNIDFNNLDMKQKLVQDRINILKEHVPDSKLKDEYQALFYLNNRQKYLTTQDKHPIDWAITNFEAIDFLCKKYKLKTVPLEQYSGLVPKDGLDELKRYTDAYMAVTGDKPIVELIIKDKKTEVGHKDRDPIMIANSPLGNFMHILGAWDDEVEVVDEIIYYHK